MDYIMFLKVELKMLRIAITDGREPTDEDLEMAIVVLLEVSEPIVVRAAVLEYRRIESERAAVEAFCDLILRSPM